MSGLALAAVLVAAAAAFAVAVRWGLLRAGETPRRAGLLAAGAVVLAVGGAVAFTFDDLGEDDDQVPAQRSALTSAQVEARIEQWKRDQRPSGGETECDVTEPKVEVERHDAWVEVGYKFETLPRSQACRPYAVVGVLLSGAPDEGKWTSIARTRITDRSGTLILRRGPLRGRPPKRADVSAVAISGASSAVVSTPLD